MTPKKTPADVHPPLLTADDRDTLVEIRSTFQHFYRMLEGICGQLKIATHPMRRASDARDTREYRSRPATAHDRQTIVASAPKVENRGSRTPTGPRVVYRPIRRTYRGKAIAADTSKLQASVIAVYKAVNRTPGQPTDRYIRDTSMNANTVRYALQILRQKKFIESTPLEGPSTD